MERRMIRVNLLPDVKQEYLKAEQTKHTVLVAAILTSISVVAIAILFFTYVQVIQPTIQKAIQKDIDKGLSEIKQKQNAQRMVTVQGVLEQIPAIKDKQQVTSRTFTYLNQFTPRAVTYNKVSLNLETNTVILSGSTVAYETANVLANNLKSAKFTYTRADAQQSTSPFSGVTFNNLGKSESDQNGMPVSFEITFQFDPILFDRSISKPVIKVNASSEQLLLPEAKPFNEPGLGANR